MGKRGPQKTHTKVTIRVESKALEKLKKICRDKKLKYNQVINELIKKYLKMGKA